MHSWGRSSYARAMIDFRANVELKDTIMVAMPELVGEGSVCSNAAKNLKNPRQAGRGVPVGPKVISIANVDSDSEVEDVVNEHAGFRASTCLRCGNDSGYGTNSLLEQWRAICNEIDIMVRGHKKK
ncbi:hypothetical protein Tco_0008901 [Tanacetum coccineum]